MTRIPKALPMHGWVIIDKPTGMTSAAVVGKVKRALRCKKVGHAGTLDPLASGVLPLALGEATKVVSYAMGGTKTYRFTVAWGSATTTDDREGEVCATSTIRPSRQEIEAALPHFTGEVAQVPPKYSAMKLQGKRAYELARQGVAFELEPRQVQIEQLVLESVSADSASFLVKCGKGTYIRSLARDLAHYLQTEGHVTQLEREQVGVFSRKNAILLEKLEGSVYKEEPSEWLRPLEAVLDDIPVLHLTSEEARAIRHGQSLPNPESREEEVVLLLLEKVPVALARVGSECIRPTRVFNLS